MNRIHPSIIEDPDPESWLWHNGILKEEAIRNLENHLKFEKDTWDTKLLHMSLHLGGFQQLNEIDGSFGCVLIKKYHDTYKMYVFTNDIVTLFIDDNGTLSSIKFGDACKRIDPNTVYEYDTVLRTINPITSFSSKSSPYYFGIRKE